MHTQTGLRGRGTKGLVLFGHSGLECLNLEPKSALLPRRVVKSLQNLESGKANYFWYSIIRALLAMQWGITDSFIRYVPILVC